VQPGLPIDPQLGCPCAPGWDCDETQNICLPPPGASADGASPDGGLDQYPPEPAASVPLAPDAGPRQVPTPGLRPRRMVNRTPDPLPAAGWPPGPVGSTPAMAYDSIRMRTVLFSGSELQMGMSAGGRRFPVWEWDGSNWEDRTQEQAPVWPDRLQAAVASFDADRGVTVLFGGNDEGKAGTFSNQTWEWNGTAFRAPAPTSAPPPRNGHAMAYDSVRKVTLMFGGYPGTGDLLGRNDLWQWDGTAWTDLTPRPLPAAWPGPRAGASLVWDSLRQRMLLFGGDQVATSDPAPALSAELWEWDGAGWSNLTPTPLPEAWPFKRRDHAAGYDPIGGTMLILGGRISDRRAPGVEVARDLWEWDPVGRLFRDLTPTSPPASWPLAGYLFTGVFDQARERLVFMSANGTGQGMDRWLYEYGP
jgi:hypothetical protein